MNKLAVVETEVTRAFHPEGSAEPSGLACLVLIARQQGLDLSVSQLIHDNLLTNQEVSVPELLKAAASVELKAELVKLDWKSLAHLKKALPAIVRLKDGASMILQRVEGESDPARVVLQDPNAGEEALLIIDQARFQDVWTGEVILVKRNYEIRDEAQPFQVKLIAALIFRDRRMVRDIAICALVLGLLSLAPILFWQVLVMKAVYYKAFHTFYVMCLAMVVLVGFETAFTYLRRFLVIHLASRLDVKLSTYVFDKILNLPIDFFERTQVGEILQRLFYIRRIRDFLAGQLFGSVLDSATLLFFLPVMFFFSPSVTFAILAVCAVIVAWLLITLPIHRRKTKELERAETERGSFAYQTIAGIRTVKSLVLEHRQRHTWDVHTARVAKTRIDLETTGNLIGAVVRPLERLAVSGGLALAVYFAMTTSDPTLMGGLFAFLMLSQRVVAPLLQVAQSINQWDDARFAIDAIGDIVNRPEEEGRSGKGVRVPLQGDVQFSNVTFTYASSSSPALQELSFKVPLGTTLGIVGRSGSGKTTVTRLLQRLHSNYEGLIKIDGVDVREFDVDHLRRSLGVVLQENFLFSGSIRENIASAKPDATFDEVVRAARLAGAEEFVDRLPRGYDTYIYEGSPNLSGGQRQRIAIARALIVDPRILILDEATSALDPESEAIVNTNLSRIAQGRSLIVVSHRLSSLVASDAILVLERGRFEDIGKHQELLERCQIYRHLWDQQNRHVSALANRQEKPPFRSPSLVS